MLVVIENNMAETNVGKEQFGGGAVLGAQLQHLSGNFDRP
jgi:hypothetical protein